MTVIVT